MAVFGFISRETTLMAMIFLSIFVVLSGLNLYFVKIDLKRKTFLDQQNQKETESIDENKIVDLFKKDEPIMNLFETKST